MGWRRGEIDIKLHNLNSVLHKVEYRKEQVVRLMPFAVPHILIETWNVNKKPFEKDNGVFFSSTTDLKC